MTERRPAEVFDPRELFREEMSARGIADDELVKTLHTWLHGGEFTDAVSDCLSLMLGTSTSLWIALHAAWQEREAGRLLPEGVTVRYGWQSGDSSPGAWSASRVAVEQP